jgi:predicted RNase H-like nuclease (RuvC/YqgF family)
MMKKMEAVDFSVYAKHRDEIKELKMEIERLKRLNEELDRKVLEIYGAYETIQYTTRGRLMSCSAEIARLRQENEELKKVLLER